MYIKLSYLAAIAKEFNIPLIDLEGTIKENGNIVIHDIFCPSCGVEMTWTTDDIFICKNNNCLYGCI